MDGSGRLLFAPAPSVRSRLRSERRRVGGLRTTPCGFLRFPHAHSKPGRPLGHSRQWKTKKPLMKPRWKNPSLLDRGYPIRGRDFINGSHLLRLPHLAIQILSTRLKTCQHQLLLTAITDFFKGQSEGIPRYSERSESFFVNSQEYIISFFFSSITFATTANKLSF